MPLRFTSGDLFAVPADIRVNTVNCVGVMGAGLALAFKAKYPAMFRVYQKDCKAGKVQPGHMHIWRDVATDETIINFPTKRHWRQPSRYEDIETGLVALRQYLQTQGNIRVALPALGAGHGGLEWNRVKDMICEYLNDLDADIQVFAPLDSQNMGQRTTDVAAEAALETMTRNNVQVLDHAEPDFPEGIKSLGTKRLYVKGDAARLRRPLLAFLPSEKPDESEIKTVTGYVQRVVQRGVTLLIGYGPHIERPAIRIALAQGAELVVFVADSLAHFSVRGDLKDVWDENNITVISIAKPTQSWSPQLAQQTRLVAFMLAQGVVLSDVDPGWLTTSLREQNRVKQLFLLSSSASILKPHAHEVLRHVDITQLHQAAHDQFPGVEQMSKLFSDVPVAAAVLDAKPQVETANQPDTHLSPMETPPVEAVMQQSLIEGMDPVDVAKNPKAKKSKKEAK